MEQNIKTMLRQDVISELRRYASVRDFKVITELPTPHLKALLTFYDAGGEIDKVEVGEEGVPTSINLSIDAVESEIVDNPSTIVTGSKMRVEIQKSQKQMFFLRLFTNVVSKRNE